MSDRLDWFNLIAISRGAPADWSWFHSEVKGERPNHVFIIKGGVLPPGAVFKSGPRKGKPNPAKRTQQSEIVIAAAQLQAFKEQWERDHGRCYECRGSRATVVTWKADGGHVTRPCKRCAS